MTNTIQSQSQILNLLAEEEALRNTAITSIDSYVRKVHFQEPYHSVMFRVVKLSDLFDSEALAHLSELLTEFFLRSETLSEFEKFKHGLKSFYSIAHVTALLCKLEEFATSMGDEDCIADIDRYKIAENYTSYGPEVLKSRIKLYNSQTAAKEEERRTSRPQ